MKETKAPWVTILILNFNNLGYSRSCLKSVLKTKYPSFKVIVADNGSVVNENRILKSEFEDERLSFVRFNKNWGFVGGINKAVKKAKSEYVVFLNNDTIVDRNWLAPLVKEMESDIKIGACQPKIKLLDDNTRFDYAGASGGFIDKYGYPFTRGRIFFTSEVDFGQYDRKMDIFWSSGVAMIVRREQFLELGKFDEMLFIYMEEIDLCWRLQNKGFRVRVVPESIIYHKVAASSSKHMLKKRFYEHRNNLILITKNYSLRNLLMLFPIRLFLDLVNLVYYICKFNFNSALALILAHLSFWHKLPRILKNRAKDLKDVESITTVYPNSIVLKYFITKKLTFNRL